MKIKIFGERNTSTRALAQMLKNNSKSEFFPATMQDHSRLMAKVVSGLQRIGFPAGPREAIIDKVFEGRHLLDQWKHTATSFEVDGRVDGVHFVFAVRDPRSWLIGLFRKPYHMLVPKPESLVEFSQVDWKPVGRDNLPSASYRPLELYAAKLRSYLELIEQLERRNVTYSIVKFEDFVSGQDKVFDEIKPFLDSPADEFHEISKSTKDVGKDASYYAKYYSRQIWREEHPDIYLVDMPEAADVFATFGYAT